MRHAILAALSVLLLAACDAFSDDAVALMENLDGTWTRTIVTERIATDGSVSAEGETRVDAFEIARSVACNSTTLDHVAEDDRAAVSFNPETPRVGRRCYVLTADGDAKRIVFVGEGRIGTVDDRAGTIRENTPSRHVWAFYMPQSDGSALRETVTLTPQ